MSYSSSILGRGVAFPPRLNDRNKLALVEGDDAIRRSIYLIIHTSPGERVMRPEFGCRIHELIFDPANSQTAATAERYIREAIARWETRIEVTDVTVVPSPGERGELLINLTYKHKRQASEETLVYPYYLNPGVVAEGEG
ncbi:MAG: GPW/gp25 family protein [Chloroflexota bacterium]